MIRGGDAPSDGAVIVVEHGRVTLTGVVASEVEKRRAEIIARSTLGVLGVENRLRVE